MRCVLAHPATEQARQRQFVHSDQQPGTSATGTSNNILPTTVPQRQQSEASNDPAADALLSLLDYSMAHPEQQAFGGPGGHPVLRLLLSRLQNGSVPGARPDAMKLGLVVEGGGMRGIVTGAMLMGLQDSGMLNVFDAVYGRCASKRNEDWV